MTDFDPSPVQSPAAAAGERLISVETARAIFTAHHEITNAEKLLVEMRDHLGRPAEITPRDAFGRQHRSYQFGVPNGDNGHRLYGVSPQLALTVVEGHIAEMKRQLAEACAVARFEMGSR